MIKDLLLFFLVCFFVFYLPGILLLKKLKLFTDLPDQHFFASVFGLVVFILVYNLFSWLNLRQLTFYVYLLILAGRVGQSDIIRFVFLLRKNLLKLTVFLAISFVFAIPVLRSGWLIEEGLQLVSVNQLDGVWNLALIQELKNNFPPQHPAIAGVPIRGYHILYNLALAGLSNVFGISPIHLLFHFFPIFIGFLWAGGVYLLVKRISGSALSGYLASFLSMFGGSFVFLFPGLWKLGLSLDDGFGVQQPFSANLNPTFACSTLLIIVSFWVLWQYCQSKKSAWLVILFLLVGVSIGVKTYAGMILLASLLGIGLLEAIVKRNFRFLFTFMGAFALALLIYLPLNAQSGFLVAYPLWPARQLMVGNLNFTLWDQKRLYYESINNNLGLVKLWLWAFGIFFFGNLGIRLLAFGLISKWIRKYSPFEYFILGCTATSFFVSILFIQPAGGAFNMIQMYWYFLFFTSILTALFVGLRLDRSPKLGKYLLLAVLFLLTIPSASEKIFTFFSQKGGYIGPDKYESLIFLNQQAGYGQTVLEIPKLASYDFLSLCGWFDSSTPVIPALGNKRTFVGGEVVSFPYKEKDERLRIVAQFMQPQTVCQNPDAQEFCEGAKIKSREIIRSNNISLIYAPSSLDWISTLDFDQIYRNNEYAIYKVD